MKLQAGGVARTRMPIVMITLVIVAVILTAGIAAVLGTAEDPLVAARAGVLGDVDTLRIAELSLYDFDERFVPCGSAEAARAAVLAGDASWRADPCWDTLGFRPAGEAGAFWVEAAGEDLVVHGIADLDGDGETLEVLATRDDPARILTPDAR